MFVEEKRDRERRKEVRIGGGHTVACLILAWAAWGTVSVLSHTLFCTQTLVDHCYGMVVVIQSFSFVMFP